MLVERPLCSLYAEGPLWAWNVRKKALLTLWALWEKKISSIKEKTPHAPHKQPSRGNLTYYAPPYGGGEGGGASWGKGQGQLWSVLGHYFPTIMNKTSFLFVHYKKSVIFAPVNLNQSIHV